MLIPLSAIAQIVTGVTLPEKPEIAVVGKANALLMQLGDLDTDGNILFHNALPILMDKSLNRFIMKPHDLVFRGRGAGIVAAVMPETDLPVIAASPLMIIRPEINQVDPAYLAWALTSDHARRHYAIHSRGSAIIGIGKRDLERLEISLPELGIQRKIGKLKHLEIREKQLLARYQKMKSRLLDMLITNAIQ